MFFPRIINRLLITWFGCGLVPVAPGTAGSVGALPICWALAQYASLPWRIIAAVLMTALAIVTAAQDQKDGGRKDPSYVVIDEVAGMMWTTLLLAPATWQALAVGFVLFRILDVVKPLPANLFDRGSKTSPSWFIRGANIVLDDVIAGLYGMLILQLLIVYVFPRFSFFT